MIQNNVKTYRTGKEGFQVTKAHLARQIGVSRSYITKLENGEITPSLDKAFRLAKYLGCSIEELFFSSDDATAQNVDKNKTIE